MATSAMAGFLLRGLALSLAAAAAGAVAAGPDGPDGPDGPVRSLAEMRHDRVLIQKWDMSCGAAALATLFTFDLDDPVSEREVATAMLHLNDPVKVRTRGGFSLLDMQDYAEGRGYQADGYGELSLHDLSTRLPAIVPVEFHGYDHFVVVRDIQAGRIFFADPAYGRRIISVREFEAAWKSRIAFVVTPRQGNGP